MKVKIALYLTTSKFAAYLILAIGTTYSFLFKDPTVLLATFSATSAVLMMKTWQQSHTDRKKIESPNYPTPANYPTPEEKEPDGL